MLPTEIPAQEREFMRGNYDRLLVPDGILYRHFCRVLSKLPDNSLIASHEMLAQGTGLSVAQVFVSSERLLWQFRAILRFGVESDMSLYRWEIRRWTGACLNYLLSPAPEDLPSGIDMAAVHAVIERNGQGLSVSPMRDGSATD